MVKLKHNKYIEDLGIDRKDLYVNLKYSEGSSNKKSLKRWKKQREKYGLDDTETWDLDSLCIQWLYSHLMRYKKVAGKHIVLDNEELKITFEGKEYTLLDSINFILEILEKAIKSDYAYINELEMKHEVKRAMHMWAEIMPYCWW